jgi:transcriptional regulator with XRE-family HTH domain
MSLADVSAAAGVSIGTIRRLEGGDSGISLGVFAMIMVALGERARLKGFFDMATDETGLLIDISNLPQRIRRRKSK